MAKQTVASTNRRVDELVARVSELEAALQQARETQPQPQEQEKRIKCGRCTKRGAEDPYHPTQERVRSCYMN